MLDAHVVSDTTGDVQLAECMLRVVGTLRFDPWVTARVARYPWVVSPPR